MAWPAPGDVEVLQQWLGRCTFPPPGTEVTCAVSGGPDSSALLALASAAELRVTAVHVDHRLRPGSEGEAAHVGRLAERFGARFRAEVVEVGEGPDLEARARAARRAVLPPDALYGHTADDQAETVLLRLVRGTGPTGLAAMRPSTHPLLGLRRSDTVAVCRELGIEALADPTNGDVRFTRNRVRAEVLPLLHDVAGRDVVPLLCRLAELAAQQADLVEDLSLPLDPCDAPALAEAPGPLAAAALRRWWAEETGIAHPPDAAALARVLAVARGGATSCDVARGWRVHRRAQRLRLVPPGSDRAGPGGDGAAPDGATLPPE